MKLTRRIKAHRRPRARVVVLHAVQAAHAVKKFKSLLFGARRGGAHTFEISDGDMEHTFCVGETGRGMSIGHEDYSVLGLTDAEFTKLKSLTVTTQQYL